MLDIHSILNSKNSLFKCSRKEILNIYTVLLPKILGTRHNSLISLLSFS